MATIRTEAFNLAYKFITETNANIFLTGKAGTGKTTFLKFLRDNPTKNMAITAPTGVAAINAGGVTLHSMFQLPFGTFIPGNSETMGFDRKALLSRIRFNSTKINFFNSLELLVIDEASMVASHTVDAIDTILRFVRHKQIPFGGVQVLFIGDLHQLQPVVKKEEWQILKNHYSSIFFFDSHVLKENIPVMIELKEIYRQKDENFISILNGIRNNNLSPEDFQILNKRMKPGFISKDGDEYITLTTHNSQANLINENKLSRLKTHPVKFSATVEGEFPEHIFPAEKELLLKEGAQVMFIRNDTEEKKYYNGKIGVITEISDDEVTVLADGVHIRVRENEWENINYSINPDTKNIEEKLIGSFTQLPLRLAWAITIHKSQGLTFEKLIIDAENAFVNGQVYVALSRATTLEGLVLTSPVNIRFLGAHSELMQWQENNYDENSLPSRFEKAREAFMKQELFGVFSFDYLQDAINKLNKEIIGSENATKQSIAWLSDFSMRHNKLNSTANTFRQQINSLWNENPESNEKLNTRIKEASVYFSSQVNDLKSFFINHHLTSSTRKSSTKIDSTLEYLIENITCSLIKLNVCMNGFRFNELASWKKLIPSKKEEIKSSYNGKHKSVDSSSNEADLYNRISDFRNEVAAEKNLPLFLIFNNSAIKDCCKILPGDKKTLMAVDGFGKSKVEEFGEDILRIVRDYCEENNIDVNYFDEKKIRGIENEKHFSITATVKQSIDLFAAGKNVIEISKERNLTQSTIEGHLAKGIVNGIVDINKILSKEEITSIAALLSENSLKVKPSKGIAGSKFSYGKMRLVQAHLIAQK